MKKQHPIARAAAIVGGQAQLARLLGVQRQLVWQWINEGRPIAAHWCPEIEGATSGQVRCEDMRPDVAWGVLRASLA